MNSKTTTSTAPPNGNGRPTAKQVALSCGVSIATVSRVLNASNKNNFSVRPELHEKITRTAEKLGYRPNLAARNLVRQRTHMISFLGCNTTFDFRPISISLPVNQ
ncbi:MAG: LacI family DNA-binding transcriptional regulator [Planctomycetota bacterium]|jgi:LacI family transcriptional regulator